MSRYRGNVIADRDSTVTQCDITATNGVVHAIDEVGLSGWRFDEPYIWSQGTILLDQTIGWNIIAFHSFSQIKIPLLRS